MEANKPHNSNKYIPDEAFRYFPKGEKLFVGSGIHIVRYIFYETQYTEFELDHLQNFSQYLTSQNFNFNTFNQEELLRTLIGCKFNYKKSLQAIQSSISWRESTMPQGLISLYPSVEPLLNSGAIYIHGRDHRYRPIIVLNCERFDLTLFTVQDYTNLLCYILEFTCTHLMVKGHIENWVIITDLNNKCLSDLPLSELKQIIGVLQNNFRCRMIVNYVVNAPRTLSFLWNIIKKFVEPHTVNKIRICRDGKPEEIKQHVNLMQFEEKYGGKSRDLRDEFWPPVLPDGPFEVDGEEIGGHLEKRKELERNNETFYSCCVESEEVGDNRDSKRFTKYYDPIILDECGSVSRISRKYSSSSSEQRSKGCASCLIA